MSTTPYGYLSGVRQDRKIDSWKFYADSKEKVDISFDVYITPSLGFRLETKSIPQERFEPIVGTDLAHLHSQAQEQARAEFNLRNELVWTDWLEIKVRAMDSYDRRGLISGAQASVSYRVIPRGERADGTAYTITENSHSPSLVKFPESASVVDRTDGGMRPISEGKIKVVEESTPANSAARLTAMLNARDSRSSNVQYSYLPDTPENRAGLDNIIAVIEQANQRLQQFLSPENLPATLERARSAGVNLLSAPSEPNKPKPRGP